MKSKIVLLILALMAVMCIFTLNTVNATGNLTLEEETKLVEDVLALIPDTMELDIKEIEFEKVYDEIGVQINKKLEEAQMNVKYGGYLDSSTFPTLNKDETIYVLYIDDHFPYDEENNLEDGKNGAVNINHFRSVLIKIQGNKHGNTSAITLGSKEFAIKYSNSDEYNNEDAQYVQEYSKKFEKMYYVREYNEKNGETAEYGDLDEYVKNFMTDNSVKCIYHIIEGEYGYLDVNTWSVTRLVHLYFFKNDILYASYEASFHDGHKITIPEEIIDTEEAYINYAKSKVEELIESGKKDDDPLWQYKLSKIEEVKIEKQGNNQWYDILGKNKDEAEFSKLDIMFIAKANTTKVIDEVAISNDIGVILEGTNINSNESIYEEMQSKAKEKGYNKVFNSYELKVVEGEISNGLTLTFSLGQENNGKRAIVLHKKHDGTYEEFVEIVKNGKISVTVTELSPFMIAMEENGYLVGDINGDGKVNTADFGLLNAHLRKKKLLTGEELARADINKDGKVNTADFGLLNAHLRKKKLLW